MQSRWHHLKEEVLDMRREGVSMTVIERQFGIPRSTLSGWFRSVGLTEEQRAKLTQNSRIGGAKGRIKAVSWHNQQKLKRLEEARLEAIEVLDMLNVDDPALLDLALAMLYWGEGAKSEKTAIASSDPKILRFVLKVLKTNYGLSPLMLRCHLHLRVDQNEALLKIFWSNELGIPLERFGRTSFDRRTAGRPTYDHYKGVCDINCGNIAIQRKLIYLYNLFCDRVDRLAVGA